MAFLESALNLVWAALAIGAFAIVIPRSAADGRKLLPVAIALVCTLLLLFPIISITDDLTSSGTVAEEWNNASRRIAALMMHGHDAPAVILMVIVQLCIIAALLVIGFLEIASAPARLLLLTANTDPRSPPRR
jgi:uncharacterized membrane protein